MRPIKTGVREWAATLDVGLLRRTAACCCPETAAEAGDARRPRRTARPFPMTCALSSSSLGAAPRERAHFTPRGNASSRQLSLPLGSTWGGRRKGAGRKPGSGPGRVAHRARPTHCARNPVHVTLRSTLKSLRDSFVFPTLTGVLRELRVRAEQFRVVHYSVQETHIHLVVEAASARALSTGLRSLTIRIAKRVNRLLMRSGPVFADRWHARPLTSPRAVRHVLVYVLANAKKHGPHRTFAVDPCSSAPEFTGFREAVPRAPPSLSTSSARTWLLAVGWKQHGLISVHERPKA